MMIIHKARQVNEMRKVLLERRASVLRERTRAGEAWGFSCMGVFYADNELKRIDAVLRIGVAVA